jgi:type VI secretion system protein ImpL
MFKRMLGWVFNRWVLAAVLLLALALLVWIVGPMVAIGSLRPLESERARGITLLVIVVAAATWMGWRAWRARRGNETVVAQLLAAPGAGKPEESADMAAVRQRFEQALGTLRQARFGTDAKAAPGWLARWSGRFLYQLPWYMIIGAPGSGKTTALRHSGLKFPLADQFGDAAVRGVGGTRHCDWWFTDQAVLIDTAGRFTTQDSDRETDRATWSGFLAMLKRSRTRQPLNGVLVAVSLTDLIARSPADRAQHAAAVRQRLQELHEQLRVRLPIYLLVTKCDLMAGFMDMFATLDKDQRAAPWGFTFPFGNGAPAAGATRGEALSRELDALQRRLADGLIDRLQAETDPQRRARIYAFPGQFAGLKPALVEYVDTVFSPSPFESDPLLRGVYLVSGTQEGTPIDRVLGTIARGHALERAIMPPQAASGRSYFLQRLLGEVVFAEQGLAGTDLKWERRRSLLAIGAYAGMGALAVGTVAAWGLSWNNNRAYVDAVAERADAVRKLVQQTPNRVSADLMPILPALEATRGLAAAALGGGAASGAAGLEDTAVPWSLGFGLFQGRKLDGAAHQAYQRMLADAMLPRLAMRVVEQLSAGEHQESQYEALKTYLMMHDPARFDAEALERVFAADWDAQLGQSITPEQREQLQTHLKALLALGPVVSPLALRKDLIDSARLRLATVSLPQRVYNRMRQQGLGTEFPEFTVVGAGGGNAPLVFQRASGAPLTRGVPGLFSYDGYHKGFQREVGKLASQLAEEQDWVLGIAPAAASPGAAAAQAIAGDERLADQVRTIYLNEYAAAWEAFVADLRVLPVTSMANSMQTTRILAAPDSPLPPLMRAMSRETTLLAPRGAVDKATGTVLGKIQQGKDKLLTELGERPATTGAPARRIESIVDDRFVALRRLVTAPEGGKAPIDGVVGRLGELQVMLVAADTALKGGSPPPASPLPSQLIAEADNAPEPLRAMLKTLGTASRGIAGVVLRDTLARDVRATVGDFCQAAVAGRFPLDRNATRDVQPADFAALFGPGGKFDQMAQRLGPYVDTGQWVFRSVDGVTLGSDRGSLVQFQRAARIRETFFGGGAPGGGVRLEFKPVEMDPALTQFILDVDGQIVRYAHGPAIPVTVQWPGPRGSNQVRVQASPSGSTGMVEDGPWALFRLFERVRIEPGAAPEKFRATFDVDGRKAVFDVTAASVRNPLRMAELREFACPMGL